MTNTALQPIILSHIHTYTHKFLTEEYALKYNGIHIIYNNIGKSRCIIRKHKRLNDISHVKYTVMVTKYDR